MEYLSLLDKIYISEDTTYQRPYVDSGYIPIGLYVVIKILQVGDAVITPLDYDSYIESCSRYFGTNIRPARISISSDLLSRLSKLGSIHEF